MKTIFIYFLLFSTLVIADEEPYIQKREIDFLDYKISIDEATSTREATAKIFQNGKLIETIEDYWIDSLSKVGYFKFIGESVAKPYLILQSYSGGANCCDHIAAYELKPQFKKVFELWSDGDSIKLLGLPNECFIEAIDFAYLRKHECYANSAMVPIRFTRAKGYPPPGKRLVIIEDKEKVDEGAALIRAKQIFDMEELWEPSPCWDPHYPGLVVEEVVKLIYKNQGKLAKKFLDNAWNPKNPHKEQFKKDLKLIMDDSTAWQQLKKKGYKYPF